MSAPHSPLRPPPSAFSPQPSPAVSVLITVYNREKYIAAAIESVLAQTFTDFELIIVDDCSTDGSVEIARRYESDPRVQVHVNERNLGDYPNRNKAASYASGKYLKYVDADDLICPHCLGVMVEAMERFPEAALGVSRAIPGIEPPAMLLPREAYREHFFGSGFLFEGPLTTILRRRAFEDAGGFEPARFTGDNQCWLKLASQHPVVLLAPELTWWRQHEEQESVKATQGWEVRAEHAARSLRIKLAALDAPECPLSETERRWLRTRELRLYARHILGRLARGQITRACFLHRQAGQGLAVLLRALLAGKRRSEGEKLKAKALESRKRKAEGNHRRSNAP